MRITRTKNAKLIEKILRSDPKLWEAVDGDETATLPDPESTYYLRCQHEEHGLLGMCVFRPLDNGVYDSHAAFLSKHWGQDHRCDQAATDAINWMFENTDCTTMLAEIPNKDIPVQLFAERIGFRVTNITDDYIEYELKNG